MERNYKGADGLVDCAAVYQDGYINKQQRPTEDTEVWSFTKRILNPAEAEPILLQVSESVVTPQFGKTPAHVPPRLRSPHRAS